MLLSAAAPPTAETWLVVRGTGTGVADLSWERIAQAYLGGQDFRLVDGSESKSARDTSRLFAGAPADHPALAELLVGLGLALEPDALLVGPRRVPAGTGLVLVTDDPDGAGRLVIFTGVDELSAFQGFTTQIDIGRPGVSFVRDGQTLVPSALLHYDTSQVEVVPLDILWWTAGGFFPERSIPDRALAVARALDGYRFVYEAATIPELDVVSFADDLLTNAGEAVDAAIQLGFHHDIIVAAREREDWLDALLGVRPGPRPVIYSLIGHPRGTNARSFGDDPVTGRPAVLLNLCALPDGEAINAALMHELVHTRQPLRGSSLGDKAVAEGIAAVLAQRHEGLEDGAALMWSADALATARARHTEIVDAFLTRAGSEDAAVISGWLTLHASPAQPADLPDRCGYYVGFEAARNWLLADERRSLAELLLAPTEQVLGTLR